MTTEEAIKQLETELAASSNDEERGEAYKQVILNLWNLSLPLTGDYADQFLQFVTENKVLKYASLAHFYKASIHFYAGEYADALAQHYQSLDWAIQTGDELRIAAAYSFLGDTYATIFSFEEAFENVNRSIEIYTRHGKHKEVLRKKSDLAAIYAKAEFSDKAIELFHQLIAEGFEDEFVHLNLVVEYIKKGQLSKAETHLQLAESFINKDTPTRVKIWFYLNGSEFFVQSKKFTQAQEYLETAERLTADLQSKETMAWVLQQYGELYSAMHEWQKAEESFLTALKTAEEVNLKQDILKFLLSLKDVAYNQGDYKKAFEYANRCLVLEKEIKKEETKNIQRILDVKQKYAVVQKEKEITEEKNRIIEKEKQESERLLLNILPAEVAEELKAKGFADAKHFNDVTVLFTDFVGFTSVSEQLTPQQLVNELHSCFKAFDEITSKYNIEKIKTVGDAYLAVCGLPLADENHADNVVNAAIEIKEFMLSRRKELGSKTFEIRIGVHSGSVVAGIVGVKKFAYDIWGDTVNTAARMEQNSEANKINISEATYELVKDKFTCEYRGEIEAKNKGKMKMYFVVNSLP
jgi:class 3 adenylate cyclase